MLSSQSIGGHARYHVQGQDDGDAAEPRETAHQGPPGVVLEHDIDDGVDDTARQVEQG